MTHEIIFTNATGLNMPRLIGKKWETLDDIPLDTFLIFKHFKQMSIILQWSPQKSDLYRHLIEITNLKMSLQVSYYK